MAVNSPHKIRTRNLSYLKKKSLSRNDNVENKICVQFKIVINVADTQSTSGRGILNGKGPWEGGEF